MTDSDLMRGYDYRVANADLTLIILRGFANRREWHQALRRVGRNGDDCKRIQLLGLEVIDQELQSIYIRSIAPYAYELMNAQRDDH